MMKRVLSVAVLTCVIALASSRVVAEEPAPPSKPSLSVGMGSDLAVSPLPPGARKPSPTWESKHGADTGAAVSTTSNTSVTPPKKKKIARRAVGASTSSSMKLDSKTSLSVGMGSDLAVSPLPPGKRRPASTYESKHPEETGSPKP